jgi:hypothetical protein
VTKDKEQIKNENKDIDFKDPDRDEHIFADPKASSVEV